MNTYIRSIVNLEPEFKRYTISTTKRVATTCYLYIYGSTLEDGLQVSSAKRCPRYCLPRRCDKLSDKVDALKRTKARQVPGSKLGQKHPK